jgi:hypothetical protein
VFRLTRAWTDFVRDPSAMGRSISGQSTCLLGCLDQRQGGLISSRYWSSMSLTTTVIARIAHSTSMRRGPRGSSQPLSTIPISHSYVAMRSSVVLITSIDSSHDPVR